MNGMPSEKCAVLAVVNPQSSSTAQSSAYVSISKFHKIAAAIAVGAIASSGTFNAKLEQATDASGTGVKDITGKAITALADTDDNKQFWINLDPAELDLANGFTFVRITLTPATAASLISGTLLGFDPRFSPASDHDLASVAEIIT